MEGTSVLGGAEEHSAEPNTTGTNTESQSLGSPKEAQSEANVNDSDNEQEDSFVQVESDRTTASERALSVADLTRVLKNLEYAVGSLHDEVHAMVAKTTTRDELLSKAYDELYAFRQQLWVQQEQKILRAFIRFHDDVAKFFEPLVSGTAVGPDRTRISNVHHALQTSIEVYLSDFNIEKFNVPDDTFDPASQIALHVEPSKDTELVGRVFHRVRPGFCQGDTIIQKERVQVFGAHTVPSNSPDSH